MDWSFSCRGIPVMWRWWRAPSRNNVSYIYIELYPFNSSTAILPAGLSKLDFVCSVRFYVVSSSWLSLCKHSDLLSDMFAGYLHVVYLPLELRCRLATLLCPSRVTSNYSWAVKRLCNWNNILILNCSALCTLKCVTSIGTFLMELFVDWKTEVQ